MGLSNKHANKLCYNHAARVWQSLSKNLVAIEEDKSLYYYSGETILPKSFSNNWIDIGVGYFRIPDRFVLEEVLPKLTSEKPINNIPFGARAYIDDDGQKLISIYWWLDLNGENKKAYWFIMITA